MKKKSLIIGAILGIMLSIFLVMAASFTPQGNVDLKNIYNITDVPYVNGINLSDLNKTAYSVNATLDSKINNINSSLDSKINSNNLSMFNWVDTVFLKISNMFTKAEITNMISGNRTEVDNRIDSINSTINNNNASWSRTDNATYDAYILANKSNSTTWWAGISNFASKWFYNSGNSLTLNETQFNISANASIDARQSLLNTNSSTWWAQISGFVTGYLYKNGNNLDVNETKLIKTIQSRTINWTSLQNYPVGCPADTFITNISDSTTCASVSASNSSSFWAGVSSFVSKWFYNSGNVLNLNETQLNLTIQSNINGNLTDYYKKSQTFNNTANINAGNYNVTVNQGSWHCTEATCAHGIYYNGSGTIIQ